MWHLQSYLHGYIINNYQNKYVSYIKHFIQITMVPYTIQFK